MAGPDSLTYGQLDARADRLARHLLAAGLAPGARVAVGTVRQAELVAALVAVLKAGGAYIVIDVENPGTGRRQLIGAEPDVLLTHAAHQAALDDGSGLRVIRFGEEATGTGDRPAEAPGVPGPAAPRRSCSPGRPSRVPSPSATACSSPRTRAGRRPSGRSRRTGT